MWLRSLAKLRLKCWVYTDQRMGQVIISAIHLRDVYAIMHTYVHAANATIGGDQYDDNDDDKIA